MFPCSRWKIHTWQPFQFSSQHMCGSGICGFLRLNSKKTLLRTEGVNRVDDILYESKAPVYKRLHRDSQFPCSLVPPQLVLCELQSSTAVSFWRLLNAKKTKEPNSKWPCNHCINNVLSAFSLCHRQSECSHCWTVSPHSTLKVNKTQVTKWHVIAGTYTHLISSNSV